MLFNEKKAAQVAAFFLRKGARGPSFIVQWSRMKTVKLMKLMYLAERRSLEQYGEPMIGDKLYSMDNGPVLSKTLNLIHGEVPSMEGGWETWVSDRADHKVSLRRSFDDPRRDLGELSDADIEILEAVWTQYGHMEAFELARLTHEPDVCPEWQDPKGSRLDIDHEDIYQHVGRSEREIEDLRKRVSDQRKIDAKIQSALGR